MAYNQRFNEVPSYDKPSYRQVGKNTGGRVVKGAGKQVILAATTPSIPSKFETKLHAQNGERDGFGGRTQRFSAKRTDIPGPGSYHKRSTMIRENESNPSCSKKGYLGGFVSATTRFSSLKQLQDSEAPGPGTYDANDPRRIEPVKTSMFIKPTTKPIEGSRKEEPLPGPGQYEAAFRSQYAQIMKQKKSANFVSKSERVKFVPNKTWVPAPGEYNTAYAADKLHGQGSNPNHSAFRSSTIRHGVDDAGKKWVPGPGDYEVEQAEIAITGDQGITERTTSMFSNTQQDRFGKPYQARTAQQDTPGPGWYSKDQMTEVVMPVSNSVFKSQTRRTIGEAKKDARPPGPAFYNPESTFNKKSFMLNGNKKW
eukprot:CAMPEP_0117759944 /NCGR_PEP_ID=MMETSP0947-20121206/16308_1 /TAXON_ID=44440 /ORGANISM="Chattonella subsalsa, Strain CCMP2191" /LENGTH=367 /DNA_ID=CAMNT_0005580485 /DNA_START=123 /DNA_END=1223 /DNA_ORIENTATION=+